jgi:hypothetical protein
MEISPVIASEALDLLPFQARPLERWDGNEDVRVFLSGLDRPLTFIAPGGSKHTSESAYFAGHFFDSAMANISPSLLALNHNARMAVEHGRRVAAMQEWLSRDDPGAAIEEPVSETPLEIARLAPFVAESDAAVGLAVKYLVAWDGVQAEALADSWFISLQHVLEAGFDVEASFLLACNGFHKQALQILRTFLEDVTLPLYFYAVAGEFERWLSDERYFIPRVQGSGGIAAKLIGLGVDASVVEGYARSYHELGKAVHGAERHVAFAGLAEGNSPPGFRVDRLHDWASWFARIVDVGIRLSVVGFDLWTNSPRRVTVCGQCHGSEFDVDSTLRGWRRTCKRCGDVTFFSLDPRLRSTE